MRTFAQEIHATALIMNGNLLTVCQVIDLAETDAINVKAWRKDGRVTIAGLFHGKEDETAIERHVNPEGEDIEDLFRDGPDFLVVDPTRPTLEEQFGAIASRDSYDDSAIGYVFLLS